MALRSVGGQVIENPTSEVERWLLDTAFSNVVMQLSFSLDQQALQNLHPHGIHDNVHIRATFGVIKLIFCNGNIAEISPMI